MEVLVTIAGSEIRFTDPCIKVVFFKEIQDPGKGKRTLRVDQEDIALGEDAHRGRLATAFHCRHGFAEIESGRGDFVSSFPLKNYFRTGKRGGIGFLPTGGRSVPCDFPGGGVNDWQGGVVLSIGPHVPTIIFAKAQPDVLT